jgi:hypothetical protein
MFNALMNVTVYDVCSSKHDSIQTLIHSMSKRRKCEISKAVNAYAGRDLMPAGKTNKSMYEASYIKRLTSTFLTVVCGLLRSK